MKILTWNINGVRTLPQYHPWNTLQSFDDILNKLEADIICFQEMKSSRPQLTKSIALPPSYHGFFSFPKKRSGYSGVATYTRIGSIVPIRAEEGLCGCIQYNPPVISEWRLSCPEAYPQQILEDEDDEDDEDVDFMDLDSQGRAVVVDLGLFVLINVYCPNNSGVEGRDKYKIDYHRVLEARVKGLIEKEKREVIVAGDLNVCAAVIDHCEGHLMVAEGNAEGLVGEEGFWKPEFRRRMRDWLEKEDGTGGCMLDTTRRLWPGRKGMFTCWNTKISARETNYGTRIDYILVTRGLLQWVKAADIQPNLKGSDHCPVYLELHDEIRDPNGNIVKLSDSLGVTSDSIIKEPPLLASLFWDEFSGKQMQLEKFFGSSQTVVKTPALSQGDTPLSSSDPPIPSINPSCSREQSISTTFAKRKITPQSPFHGSLKTKKRKETESENNLDNVNRTSTGEVKQAWSNVFAPVKPPKCIVHGEEAKEYTVNKPGPNKGKRFFICSRPVGPGYDLGRGERLREHVNPLWKCDFFKWSSDVKKEMRK